MLYLNGVRFNTKNNDPNYEHAALVKEFHDTIKESQKKYGQYMVLETRHRPHPDEKTGVIIFPGTKGLLLRTVRQDDNGNTEEWIYSENILGKKDNSDELDLKTPNLLIEKSSYIIDLTRNPDLAYYVLKSGRVGRTEAEGKKFHIRDDAAKGQANAEERRIESKVGYMIYTAITEANLKTLAKSWGISNVNMKHIDIVREELYNKVQQAEKEKRAGSANRRGYKEFLESSDVKVNDKVAALCVDAEEKGFLVYDVENRSWMINYQDSNLPYRLKELAGGEFGDPLGSLVNFLIYAPEELRRLETVLNRTHITNPKDTTNTADITFDMVQQETNALKLKKWLRQLDPQVDIPKTHTGDQTKEMLFAVLAAHAI